MCFAYGTPVGVPGGSRPIEDFRNHDAVLAATARDGGWEWRPGRVEFSDGASPDRWGPGRTMIVLELGEGAQLVVTPDQPLLLASGLLRRADHVRPRHDRLVAARGGEVEVLTGAFARLACGIHSLATDINRRDSLDGHLLACGGVICGDFVLQGRGGGGELTHLFAPDPGSAGPVGGA